MKNINHNEPLVRGHRDHREQGKISAFFALFLGVLCYLCGFFLKKIPHLNCGSSLALGSPAKRVLGRFISYPYGPVFLLVFRGTKQRKISRKNPPRNPSRTFSVEIEIEND
jgi:hypothetical protein